MDSVTADADPRPLPAEQRCGLCDDAVEHMDYHVNRFHRMMPDRYRALVGGFVDAGRQAVEAERERDALAADLAASRAQRDSAINALEHIEAITAPEMEPLYSVRPMPSAAVSAHKIAKCAVAAF